MTLASRTTRLLGEVIDALVGVAPVAVVTAALSNSIRVGGMTYFRFLTLLLVLGLLWSLYYFLLADSMSGGQSIAKKWLGMRVVDGETGEPCTFGQSFVRNILLLLLGPLDWFFIFGERHQRLGDIAAGTVVVSA